jgi:diadenosine tetraphosphate (Ap4A) HIT family hydrolase
MRRLAKEDVLARLDPRPTCWMCELARDAPAIASNDHAVAILDRFASRPGHVLVILRRHAEHVAGLPYADYEAMHRLAWEMSRALDRVLAPRRIYVAALGSAQPLATSFPHVHVHVIPLADGGDADRPAEVFTWVHGMYVFDSDDEEREFVARLRAAHG